jgi:hypothetical protein
MGLGEGQCSGECGERGRGDERRRRGEEGMRSEIEGKRERESGGVLSETGRTHAIISGLW